MREAYSTYLTKVLGIREIVTPKKIQMKSQQIKVLFFEWCSKPNLQLQNEMRGENTPTHTLRQKMISAMQIAPHEFACTLQSGGSAEEVLGSLKNAVQLNSPKIIVAFGDDSASLLKGTTTSVSQERGQCQLWHKWKYWVTYSPSHLLSHTDDKKMAWEDLQSVMKGLDGNLGGRR